MPSTIRAFASALVGAAAVSAHGFVESININGVLYSGYVVTQFPYQATPPVVVGWETTATDTGFVGPQAFADPDIVCHRDGKNAQGYAEVNAGDNVFLQWNDWPDSHRGPVLDYLAPCGDAGCASVDKTALEFFKISESGLDGAKNLMDNDMGWMVKIPENIAPGFYVLRHEIIALHSGFELNGAQNYPQCFSLLVKGTGTEKPAGVPATQLYKPEDAGIHFNLYDGNTNYPVPGPAMIEGGELLEQFTSAVASTGTASTGTNVSPAPTDVVEAPQEPAVTTTEAASQPTVDIGSSSSQVPSATSVEAPQVTEKPVEKPVCNGKRKAKRSKKTVQKRSAAARV